MKIKNKKNKISKKIILSTIVLSSFVTVGMSFLPSISKTKENINTIDNDTTYISKLNEEENTNSKVTAGVATKLVPKANVASTIYPFQINIGTGRNGDYGNVFKYFEFQGQYNETQASTGNTLVITMGKNDIQTNGSTTSGAVRLNISGMVPWVDSGGHTNTSSGYSGNAEMTGMKSVSDATKIEINSAISVDRYQYASDHATDTKARNFLMITNGITATSASPPDTVDDFTTTFSIPSVVADNQAGTLRIEVVKKNYVTNDRFYQGEAASEYRTISGFKKIGGPTGLEVTQIAPQTRPSALFSSSPNGIVSESDVSKYFVLTNPLTKMINTNPNAVSTKITEVKIVEAFDNLGELKIEMKVTGGYYNSVSIPEKAETEATISLSVGGFRVFVEQEDQTMLFVGVGIGGLFGVIAVVVGIIILIKTQKRKNEEARKRKSMEDRLSMASNNGKPGSPAGGPPKAPGSGVAPGALGARPGVAPGAAPGTSKYVPPTISVPKSNAPQAKRPAGPLPVKK